MAKNLNKSKRYSLDEDIEICQTASSTAMSVSALARLLARKLHRTPEGIETRIAILRGQRKGVPATDNGIRLNGTPKNFLIEAGGRLWRFASRDAIRNAIGHATVDALDGTPVNVNASTPKFKRSSLPVLEPVSVVSVDTLAVTINGIPITGSAETLRTLLNLQ